MKLKEYLTKYRMSAEEFATKYHMAITTVYRCLRGERMGRNTAKRIEEDTKGEVSFDEARNVDDSKS
jgi:predicted transcriptional regulator